VSAALTTAKRPMSADEEDFGEGVDELLSHSRKRKRKAGRPAVGTLPADLAGKLGDAHLNFVRASRAPRCALP